MNNGFEITCPKNNILNITAIPGHFVTSHSHINYYIDITRLKHSHIMAMNAAEVLASAYASKPPVDTIVCMDGSEVVGAFLAKSLSETDLISMNNHIDLEVITPEFNSNGQMIFRDNLIPMVAGKNVILLIASVTTGKTIKRALECINYYGGQVEGISAVFSAIPEMQGIPINSLFSAEDIPGYITHSMRDCPQCRDGVKIDALVNSYGYSEL